MEFLPSIEVLNFLDWIDSKGIAENNRTTRLMKDGVITAADLEGFSEGLKEYVLDRAGH